MKHLRLLISLSAMVFAACGGAGNRATLPSVAARPASGAAARDANLYVLNLGGSQVSTVTIYAPGSESVLRTISNGMFNPNELLINRSGALYVANYGCTWSSCSPYWRSTVTAYAPGSDKPFRTIVHGVDKPSALAFDGDGNLFVANCGTCNFRSYGDDSVKVYAPGSKSARRAISQGVHVPDSMAFDVRGNLYVANLGCYTFCSPSVPSTVTVYAPGSNKILRTISDGVALPRALAFDDGGNLYVANYGGGTVTVYAPGETSVLRTISKGIRGPAVLAFDRTDNLYVAACNGCNGNGGGSVAVFAAGSNALLRTITDGVAEPTALAIGHYGDLYVANGAKNTVTVYAPGSTQVLRTISQGVMQPYGLAFGP